jgi:glycerol-3-phosphate dehydrogenase (NAD(P)+)
MTNRSPQTHRISVLIVGFGQMGHAMRALLKDTVSLSIWRVTPDNLRLPATIREAACQAEYVLLCVPTIAIATALTPVQAYMSKRTIVLSIAKGLDDSGHTAADILQKHLGLRARWGVLGGPMIANELRAGRYGFAELGSRDTISLRRICRLFHGTRLHLTPNRNPHAVSWCGVLKNVYVPLIGLSDGLGWGDNLRGQLVSTALAEMNALIQQFCGVRHAADGIAGLADLVTTATSRSSHHRALGWRVAHGSRHITQGEGAHTLQVLMRHASRFPASKFPLLQVAAALVHRPQSARSRLAAWIESSSQSVGAPGERKLRSRLR